MTGAPFDDRPYFDRLKQACTDAAATAGTHFDDQNAECVCPDGPNGERAMFVVGGVGVGARGCRTVNVVTSNSCASTANGYTAALGDAGSTDALSRCLEAPAGLTDRDEEDPLAWYGIRLQDASIAGAAGIASAVAQWADAHLAVGSPLRLKAPRGLWQPDGVTIHVGKALDEEVNAAVGQVLRVEFRERDMAYSPVFFEPDPAALDWIFSKDVSPAQRDVLFPAPPVEAGLAASDMYEAFRALVVDRAGAMKFAAGERVHGDGCAGTCQIEGAATTLLHGASARLERVYSFGTVLREAIWIERDGVREGLVVLAPSGVPGLLVTFDQHVDADRQAMDVRAYDRTWATLGTGSRTYELKPKAADLASRIPSAPLRAGHGLVLCEASAVSYLTADDVAKRLARGPHAPTFGPTGLSGGSVFGWYPNDHATLETYSLGVRNLQMGFYPRPERDDHAARVARVALGNVEDADDVRLLPMGGEECFTRFSDWYPAASGCCDGSCARVVNVSSAFVRWKSDCEEVARPALTASKASLLWVVGAGNGGTNGKGRDTPVDLCPQSLAGAENLIVVAAEANGRLATYSDYGAQYADLAANGEATDGSGDIGTSFAAPRVAAVATRIAIRAPSLSPAETRIAILASAAPSDALKEQVRSGGTLDPKRALDVATCLADPQSVGALEARVRACVAAVFADAAFANDRIALLKAHGVKFE